MPIERPGQNPNTIQSSQTWMRTPSTTDGQSKLVDKREISYSFSSSISIPDTDSEPDTLMASGPQQPTLREPSRLRRFGIAAANLLGNVTTRDVLRGIASAARGLVAVAAFSFSGVSDGVIALSKGLRDAYYRRQQANRQRFRRQWMENNSQDLTEDQKSNIWNVRDERLKEVLNFRTRSLGGVARKGFTAGQRDLLMRCVMSILSGGGSTENVKNFVDVLNMEVRKPGFDFDENTEVGNFKDLAREYDKNFIDIGDMILQSEPDLRADP